MLPLPLNEHDRSIQPLCDVWLKERAERERAMHGKLLTPKTVFVLQDWGVLRPKMTLQTEIAEICEATESETHSDPTLRNLFSNIDLAKFRSGRIAIINAVPGVRPPESKRSTGYLGAPIHRKAFKAWHEVLKKYARQNSLKHVFFCGEWAKWKDIEWGERLPLQDYLERWKKWADYPSQLSGFDKISCQVIIHPCMWHFDINTLKKQTVKLDCWQ